MNGNTCSLSARKAALRKTARTWSSCCEITYTGKAMVKWSPVCGQISVHLWESPELNTDTGLPVQNCSESGINTWRTKTDRLLLFLFHCQLSAVLIIFSVKLLLHTSQYTIHIQFILCITRRQNQSIILRETAQVFFSTPFRLQTKGNNFWQLMSKFKIKHR